MELFQLIGIAFITAIAALLLKGTKPELSLAVTIAGSVLLLLFAFETLKSGFSLFGKITQMTGLDSSLVKALLKMIGIGYLVEFSSGILNDFNQTALADKLTFCGKILVFILAIPIIESVLKLIIKLLEFI